MPIHEYVVKKGYEGCMRCSKPFEYLHEKMNERLKVCPHCESPLEILISNTSFRLKGNGWAKDLYSKPK